MLNVQVIASSTFHGVPEELQPEPGALEERLYADAQDKGTDAERLIECAGRTCYDSYGTGRRSAAFHDHIRNVGHGSVLEHASISFFISGVSRGLTHELVRHRVGVAISQRSTRYVDEAESPNAWHPLIWQYLAARPGGGSSIEKALGELEERTREVYRALVAEIKLKLIERGVDALTARKQARGAARGALPNVLSTSLVWTANLRALRHFLEERASGGADGEIRLCANAIYEAALPYAPEVLGDYSRHDCPDGIGYELRTQWRKV